MFEKYDLSRYNDVFNTIENNDLKNVIVIGPTGSGKTTIVKILLKQLIDENSFPRIFYLLPTRSLLNAKYEEFEKFVGQLGTKAKMSKLTAFSDEKNWFSNLNISTYDFYYLVRAGMIDYYGRNRQVSAYIAYNVYDEIHTFEAEELGKILSIMTFSSNNIILTATLHPKIKELFEKELKTRTVYLEPFNTSDRVTNFEITNEDIVKIYDAEKTKKNLIIVNTVPKALEIYRKITGDNRSDEDILSSGGTSEVVLLTSSTSLGARERIEKELEKSDKIRTVVATQVAEVGLNWDPDLLITEAAPIDSLVQRIGRIRTRGKAYVIKTGETPIYDEVAVKKSLDFLEKNDVNELLRSNELTEKALEYVYSHVIDDIISTITLVEKNSEENIRSFMLYNKKNVYDFRSSKYVYFFDARSSDIMSFDRLYRGSFVKKGKKYAGNYIFQKFKKFIKENGASVKVIPTSEFVSGKSVYGKYKEVNFYRVLNSVPENSIIIIDEWEEIL